MLIYSIVRKIFRNPLKFSTSSNKIILKERREKFLNIFYNKCDAQISRVTSSVDPPTSDIRGHSTFNFVISRVSREARVTVFHACVQVRSANVYSSLLSLHGPKWGDFDLRWTFDAKGHLIVRIKRIATCRCRNFVQRLGASRLREWNGLLFLFIPTFVRDVALYFADEFLHHLSKHLGRL